MTGLTNAEALARLREWKEDIASGFGGECDDLGGSNDWCCLRHRQRHADLTLAIVAIEQRGILMRSREDVSIALGKAIKQRERVKALEQAASAFVAAYDLCAPAISSAFQMAAIHGMPYSGPTLGVELAALRELVAKSPTET